MAAQEPKSPAQSGNNSETLHDLKNSLQAVDRLINDLKQAVSSLPRVDRHGGSDCPFAEELYAEKEKLHSALHGRFQSLQAARQAVGDQISECERKLGILSNDRNKIGRERIKSHYDEAGETLLAEHRHLVSKRNEIDQRIAHARKALETSSQRQWPGKSAPRKYPKFENVSPPSRDDVDQPLRPIPTKAGASSDIDGLMSIGYARRHSKRSS